MDMNRKILFTDDINAGVRLSFFQKLALITVCIYVASLYFVYINSSLHGIQGLLLYGMVGLMAIVVLQRGRVRLNQYLILYGMFIVWAIISCLYSADKSRSTASIYGLLVVWAFALVLSTVITKKVHIEMMLSSLIIGSVILVVFLILSGQFINFDDTGSRFGETLTGNANVFAAIYMIAASASVYFIYRADGFKKKLPYVITFALQLYAMTVSGGRKYFIFPFILMYFMSLLRRERNQIARYVKVTVVTALAAFIIYMLMMKVDFLYNSIGYRFEDFVNYVTGQSETVETGTIRREEMVRAGLKLWGESPIWGHGLNSFATVSGIGVYSHNNFIEILSNHGVIGFIIYYGIYICALLNLAMKSKNDIMRHFLMGFVISLFIYDLGAIGYCTLITQMFLVFAIIYARIVAKPKETPNINAAEETVTVK